jgi:hypothetical protein
MVKSSRTKSLAFYGLAGAMQQSRQMCPTGADFKHFGAAKIADSLDRRNISSIMQAKVLSIMEDVLAPVTAL